MINPFPDAPRVVHKYGGSSVATPELICAVAKGVASRHSSGQQIVVVVSAMGKTTNQLIELAGSVSLSPHSREMDMLLATGEQMSASLLAMALGDLGIPALSLNAFQMGMLTTGRHSVARIRDINASRLKEELNKRGVVVVTGFQGITEEGDVTTLGRGGSDTSAIAIASSLDCPCEIYSDVAGIFATDPRIEPGAKRLEYVTCEEMLELASLGAKVLHSRAVEIAQTHHVPLYCGSTFSDERGTFIVNQLPEWLEQPVVTGVAIDKDQTRVTLRDIPAGEGLYTHIFTELATKRINLDMIALATTDRGTASVTFTVVGGELSTVRSVLDDVLKDCSGWSLTIDPDVAKVSAVGVGMQSASGVAGRFFSALDKAAVTVLGTTTSEIKIATLVPLDQGEKALKALMCEFERSEQPC